MQEETSGSAELMLLYKWRVRGFRERGSEADAIYTVMRMYKMMFLESRHSAPYSRKGYGSGTCCNSC
jgi:hypothetical protein